MLSSCGSDPTFFLFAVVVFDKSKVEGGTEQAGRLETRPAGQLNYLTQHLQSLSVQRGRRRRRRMTRRGCVTKRKQRVMNHIPTVTPGPAGD